MRLGYCCINLSLPHCKVNRGMIQKTFKSKGLPYCSELALQNLDDMLKILNWNLENNIYVYRMSSNLFPWFSDYELEKLPNFDIILNKLLNIGNFIKNNNMRCGFHPGPFNVINSENASVVDKTIFELSQHAKILDLMNLDKSHYYGLNIHINNSKPDKKNAIKRFINNFKKLPESVSKRLTIENDDKLALYTPLELIYVYEHTGIPVVFDNLHYELNKNELNQKKMIDLCAKTWGNITQLIHWSSSKKIHEDSSAKSCAHADYLFDKINLPEYNIDVEIEAKAKELALLKYKHEINKCL
jgi:UV DNA damage endonuclease